MNLRFLWLIKLDHHPRMRHGGNLRWFNLSRELLRRGHETYFAINRHPRDELPGRRAYLEELREEGTISGFVEVDYPPPAGLLRAGHLLTHPPLVDAVLRRHRQAAVRATRAAVAELQIDVCVVSYRALLFVVPPLTGTLPVVIDWTDSYVLQGLRTPIFRRGFKPVSAGRTARALLAHLAQERFYTRRASASLVVSPVDKRCMDVVTGVPSKVRVLLNGIEMEAQAPLAVKEPGRLIFTGNMDFGPNYEAAIWFIDEVLPLIARRRQECRFVVAGRNPVPELRARAGERVSILGTVDDLGAEISRSALYVAPLVSGGGFKNKILEAIASGTYIAATPLAVEFLPPDVQRKLLVADGAKALAEQVLKFLENPAAFEAHLPRLREEVRREFTWARRCTELLDIVAGLPARTPRAGLP